MRGEVDEHDEAGGDELVEQVRALCFEHLADLFASLACLRRADLAAKRRGDAVASQAIKILMNSFYGVLGTPACRFHNAAIANAIYHATSKRVRDLPITIDKLL